MSTSNVTINTGGVIINNASLATVNTISSGMTFYKRPFNKTACMARRGGPRSKIYCEIYKEVPHDIHMGRGKNKWFSWRDENE